MKDDDSDVGVQRKTIDFKLDIKTKVKTDSIHYSPPNS